VFAGGVAMKMLCLRASIRMALFPCVAWLSMSRTYGFSAVPVGGLLRSKLWFLRCASDADIAPWPPLLVSIDPCSLITTLERSRGFGGPKSGATMLLLPDRLKVFE
jgi:hypothetical protein